MIDNNNKNNEYEIFKGLIKKKKCLKRKSADHTTDEY